MESNNKVREMTPEEAKQIDLTKIEYIVLSSGERVYIKKSEPKKEEEKETQKKDLTGFDELKKNVQEKETKQEILKVTQGNFRRKRKDHRTKFRRNEEAS